MSIEDRIESGMVRDRAGSSLRGQQTVFLDRNGRHQSTSHPHGKPYQEALKQLADYRLENLLEAAKFIENLMSEAIFGRSALCQAAFSKLRLLFTNFLLTSDS